MFKEIVTKREQAEALNIPKGILDFAFSEERGDRVLNQESLMVGDTITLNGFPETKAEGEVQGKHREWIALDCSGARSTVSLSRLIGTQKMSYFDVRRKDMPATDPDANYDTLLEIADGENLEEIISKGDYLKLSQRERQAICELQADYIGKTLKIVAIAHECGRFNAEYCLFKVVA